MTNKRPTWKERLEKKRKENFIGRREYLEEFSKDLASDDHEYLVFSVTGEGGVGKSTLLLQFANIAATLKAITITCNDKHLLPAQAMGHIAAELANLGISHKEFDDRYKKYRELRDEVESDPKAPRGFIDVMARVGADFAIKSGRQVPGLGALLEDADTKAAGEATAQALNYLVTRWGNKDEVMLLRETDRVLSPLFLGLLSKAAEKRRVLLIFDVFERTGVTLWPWLLALFNNDYGDLDGNLCFVIAGRDRLEQHRTELAGSICIVELEPFTSEETQLYLANQGITDEKLVHQIHEDTGGLPVLVELLAATRPQPGVPLPDVSKDAVERFLQWILEEARRQAALLAAVPRQFNRDILSAALGDDATSTFQWLSAQSFVRRNAENGCFYHERVREFMLRYLRQTIPKDLDETHTRLASFFTSEQANLNLENKAIYGSKSWKNYECERLYHLVSAQPDRYQYEAVDAFLQALQWEKRFADRIARCFQQCGREKESNLIQELASTLSEIHRAYDQNDYQSGLERLSLLELLSNLTVTSRCEIYLLFGYFYINIEKQTKALLSFDRAIELDPKNARAVANRGVIYQEMKRYKDALADFNRAIELDPKNAWAVANRGVIYGLMKRYKEALDELNCAIELNENSAFAITNRGQTHRMMMQYEDALADFDRAIELDAKDAWAIGSRGQTYRDMTRYEEALADFNRAIELDAKNSWAIAQRGETYRAMKQYEEALADFSRAIELDAKDAWAVAQRGETYRAMKQYEEALADFNRAIELDAKDAYVIAHRGVTYNSMKQYKEALADFNWAISLDAKDAHAIVHRGQTHREMKRYEDALADFNRAIKLDAKYAWVAAQRGETYRAMERYEKALADFNRSIKLEAKDAWAIAQRGSTYRSME
ncbi:MAG: tetratricopeptide repeat protein, partial [Acidobacteria bacterium]|nr:tetratricopeptide repeat protein [Acidobacteriota bacterium]